MLKRTTRSSSYQCLFLERSVSNDMLEGFSNDESISARLNPYAYDEKLLELTDQLKEEFWRIVKELTPRQQEVIELYVMGKTQMEIAKELNISQSTVTKNVNGSCLYGEEGEISRFYGGSHKRLKKLIETDPKINEILDKMAQLRAEKW